MSAWEPEAARHLPSAFASAFDERRKADLVDADLRALGVAPIPPSPALRKRVASLALESRGGALDAYTAREHTVFQAHFLDRDLDVANGLLRDLIFDPLLREDDLGLERQVILDELAQVGQDFVGRTPSRKPAS